MGIREKYDEYVERHIFEPLYASVSVRYKDDGSVLDGMIIKLSESCSEDSVDDRIFYYCRSVKSLEELTSETNSAVDFVILPHSVEFFEKL